MRRRDSVCVGAALCVALLSACSGEVEEGEDAQTARLTLAFTRLAPLAGGAHYEGWGVGSDGSAESTGKFNISAQGQVVSHPGGQIVPGATFEVPARLRSATRFVVSIEPAGDADALPAATKVLAGPVAARAATLSIAAPDALGTDFSSASGEFSFLTPTDDVPDNDNAGLWFLTRRQATPEPGLSIPTLPEGWRYEGWAVVNEGTADEVALSTGKFRTPVGADEAAPFSGPGAGAGFPGEDFVSRLPPRVSMVDLTVRTRILVSVEPEPDDSPLPSFMKPLAQAMPGVRKVLDNAALATNPAGTVTIE